MSYLTYEDYKEVQGLIELSREEFDKRAPYADLVIDHWTLERVKRAVERGKKLPKAVRLVYCQIVDNLEEMTATGDRVERFSNGQDDYTFYMNEDTQSRVWHNALMLLPVEWISGCVSYPGGADAR